jgi:hypothetical protein
MSPRCFFKNMIDRGPTDPIFFGQHSNAVFPRGIFFPDFFDLFYRKLRSRISVSNIVSSTFFYRIFHVLFGSSKKKMVGIDARRVVAPMQDKKTFRDWTDVHLERNSMCPSVNAVHGEMAISPLITCAYPRPAFAFSSFTSIKSFIESIDEKWRKYHTRTILCFG